jgi:hypothetical protein
MFSARLWEWVVDQGAARAPSGVSGTRERAQPTVAGGYPATRGATPRSAPASPGGRVPARPAVMAPTAYP